jgi:hypothetical protein
MRIEAVAQPARSSNHQFPQQVGLNEMKPNVSLSVGLVSPTYANLIRELSRIGEANCTAGIKNGVEESTPFFLCR